MSSSINRSSKRSNLESFLHAVTPSIPSQTLPLSSSTCSLTSLSQPSSEDTVEYFTLQDLWQRYDKWSAYGVEVTVVLDSGEIVQQYYVPSLSAIQVYTNKSFISLGQSNEENDESETCSDTCESDKLSRSLSNNSSRAWDATSDEGLEQDSSWTTGDKLYYQFCAYDSPYARAPLFQKITELAHSNPGLKTLKDVDLSPSSWMAVAWYPIYSIPYRKNEKDLSTAFLTYHALSSSFQDSATKNDDGDDKDVQSWSKNWLRPFGLATYKLQGALWLKHGTADDETMIRLRNTAGSWLKQLSFDHQDYNFFVHR